MNIDTAFKKPTSFSVTQTEDDLIRKIMNKGIDKVEILRRGIVSYCDELEIPITASGKKSEDSGEESLTK